MPTVNLKGAAAIVGIHEHVTRYAPDKSELQIQGESVIKAVEDAGLSGLLDDTMVFVVDGNHFALAV